MSEAWNASVLMSAHTNVAAAAASYHHHHHPQPHAHQLYNYDDYDAVASQQQRPAPPPPLRQQQPPAAAVNVYDLSTDQLRRVLTLLIRDQPRAVNESIGLVLGLGGVNAHADAATGTGTAQPVADVGDTGVGDEVVHAEEEEETPLQQPEQHRDRDGNGQLPTSSELSATGASSGGDPGRRRSTSSPNGGRKRSREGVTAVGPGAESTLDAVATETDDEPPKRPKRRAGGSNPWLRHYEELRQFHSEHGHCRLTIGYKENPSLGRWCDNQRQAHRRYVKIGPSESWLDPDRIKLLEDIGFEWRLSKVVLRPFDDRYRELVDYNAKYGHTKVPSTGAGDHASLGKWVSSQRSNFKDGRLSQDKIDKLDAIGFDWRINEPYVPWNVRVEELKAFHEEHGHWDVPHLYTSDPNKEDNKDHPYYSLGMWLYQQKTQYKLRKAGKKNWLNDDRVAALRLLGFDWEGTRMATVEENWDKRYDALKAYKEKFGTCHMNSMFTKQKDSEYRALSRWYWLQSSQYRKHIAGQKSTMNPERLAKLDALEFHQAVFGPRKGKTGNGTLREAVKAEVAKKMATEKERKAKKAAAARARRLAKGKIRVKRGKGGAAKESNQSEEGGNDPIPSEAKNKDKVIVDAPASRQDSPSNTKEPIENT